MNLLYGLDGLRQLPKCAAVSIGNFDGVHRGHQALIKLAKELSIRATGGVAVVTFEPHPMTVLRPEQAPPRLISPETKRSLLEQAGVQTLVSLAPTQEILDLTAEQFWRLIADEVKPAHLIEGPSFYFGKGRGGSVEKLREWSTGTDIALHVVEPVEAVLLNLSVVRVSSSLVRWLIAHGRVREAAICLGRPYALEGPVVQGFQRGRTIGIPTANLDLADQLVPADGVYAGRASVGGVFYPAAVSIGTLPTFKENHHQIEAHLIGYSGDLYGQTLKVDLLDWLREQRRYDGIDALKRQIDLDLADVAARQTSLAQREVGMAAPSMNHASTA